MKKFKINFNELILLTISSLIILVSQIIPYLKIVDHIYLLCLIPPILMISVILNNYNEYLSSFITFVLLTLFLPNNMLKNYNLIISIIIFYMGFYSNFKTYFSLRLKTSHFIISLIAGISFYIVNNNISESLVLFVITNILLTFSLKKEINLILLSTLIIIYFVYYNTISHFIQFLLIFFVSLIIIEIYELFLVKKIKLKIIIFIIAVITSFYNTYVDQISNYFLGLFISYFIKLNIIEKQKEEPISHNSFILGLLFYLNITSFKLEYNYIILIILSIVISYTLYKNNTYNLPIELITLILYTLSFSKIKYIAIFILITIIIPQFFFKIDQKEKS